MHTANLILRFLLELVALAGFATLAWGRTEGIWRFAAAVAVIVLIGAIWATFAVPDDPSRSGNAPVPIPGGLRLILEFAILLGGAWAFHLAGHSWVGLSIVTFVVVHYSLWIDRIVWLLQR
jgi:hypothetical protein